MKHTVIILLILMIALYGCAQQSAGSEETTLPSTAATAAPTEAPTAPPATEPPTEATAPTTEPPTDPPTDPPTEPPVVLTLPEQILQNMTTEEKVGQLFLARCPSYEDLEDVTVYHLGGYVLFGRDFEERTQEEVQDTIASYQAAAKIPMLIAVDEEGGIVCRVSDYFRDSRFPAPRTLYDQGGLDLVLSIETEKIQLLQAFGINVNLAPVCDVTTDPDAFMYSRSLGQSPEETGRVIAAMVDLMNQSNLGSVLKHFPGYGNNTDTHIGIAVDDRTLDELEAVDLVPFAKGIEAGAGAIMVSHTFVNCLDAELPASLSPAVIGYLRNEMGFDGVIVTDDLVMEAITDLYGAGESAVLAVLAGNDLLCSSEYWIQYPAVLEAVESGRISEEILDAAVLRVLNWKYDLGLLDNLT